MCKQNMFEIVSIFFDSSEGQNSPFENQQTKILLRALKLPRLLRVSRLLIFLNRSKYKTIFKILRLFFVLFLAAHWGGCLFFWLCELQTPEIQFGVSSTLLNRDMLNDPLTVQPVPWPSRTCQHHGVPSNRCFWKNVDSADGGIPSMFPSWCFMAKTLAQLLP